MLITELFVKELLCLTLSTGADFTLQSFVMLKLVHEGRSTETEGRRSKSFCASFWSVTNGCPIYAIVVLVL
ncbi:MULTISPECIES: hypothetical protein [Nostocales]|uniref:Uncharacterized protein n=3 Tax=Nostocales TaxID=1161 RepID=A0A0C1RCG6_9CYAN|nr:hypothetical protein [Tolypothrix bouteillei]KAF3887659.1 hypothetical protein DA73_0400020835 [Tolypothrix bouteillei VB521301]